MDENVGPLCFLLGYSRIKVESNTSLSGYTGIVFKTHTPFKIDQPELDHTFLDVYTTQL